MPKIIKRTQVKYYCIGCKNIKDDFYIFDKRKKQRTCLKMQKKKVQQWGCNYTSCPFRKMERHQEVSISDWNKFQEKFRHSNIEVLENFCKNGVNECKD